MYEGVLIAESLRSGVTVDGLRLVVEAVHRVTPADATPDQPDVWTLLEFQVGDAEVDHLVGVLTSALARPGWYTDLRSPEETVVVFPDRVFRYPRGDLRTRTAAVGHGRTLGIPYTQLDWPV